MKNKLIIAVLLIILILVVFAMFSYVSLGPMKYEPQKSSLEQVTLCKELCMQNKGQDFSSGPCLSNEIKPDWVCDIAHSPRQDIDNLPENQCSALREGRAHHFVEVDENCDVIRVV